MNTKYIHIGKSTILWEKTSFSRAFKFLKNNSLSRAELSDDNGNVKNIHYGDILIKFSECLYADEGNNIPYIINDNIAYKLLKLSPLINGDIVFADAAEDNTVGKCIEIITHNDTDLVAGLHTIPCRPTIKFAEGYLGYYLNSTAFHNQLLQYIQGTKISSISKKSICQTIISYPSEIINQQKIASYFQSLDSLIQSTSKKLASLKRIKAASLQSMFPQKGETVPKVRFKGFEGEWEKIQLNKCLDISNNINIHNTYGINDVLSISDEAGVVNQIEFLGRSFAGKSLQKYKILKTNQLVYTKSPLKAKPYGIIKKNFNRTGIVSTLYAIYDCKDNVSPEFIHYYFDPCYRINQYLSPLVNKGAKNTMNISDETALSGKIWIPSLQEQQKIASYFCNLDKRISLQTQRLEKLKQIKAACLDKMFI